MENVQLIRYKCDDKQTLGKMYLKNDITLNTLELDWDNNLTRTSCIPQGCYQVRPRFSDKYGNHFHVKNVKDRSLILIHHGNYHKDILGCILVGKGLSDINKDGRLDVTNSKKAMDMLLEMYPNGFDLEIFFGTIDFE